MYNLTNLFGGLEEKCCLYQYDFLSFGRTDQKLASLYDADVVPLISMFHLILVDNLLLIRLP
jgi:hypothetical protein